MEGVYSRHPGRIETNGTITTENEKAMTTIGTEMTVITKEAMTARKIMIMIEIEEITTETEAVNTKERAETTITIELVITTEASPRTG